MIGPLFHLIFPEKCILCRRVLKKEELDLCGSCQSQVPEYPRWDARIRHVTDAAAVWHYEKDVRASILRYKFNGARHYAAGYGRRLAMRVLRDLDAPDVIVWVPVSKKRLRQRGYDQVELLAKAAAKELGVPCGGYLEKIKDNKPNSSLESAAERRANVQNAYRVRRPEDVAGRRVLLVDDVITTGATMSECARMLRQAGAADVIGAAVAAGRKTK